MDRDDKKPLIRWRDSGSEAFVWAVKGYRPPENFYNRRHELAGADLYVAYYQTNKLEHWDANPEAHKKLLKLPHKLKYDRRMKLEGKTFYWEIDRGTEELDVIRGKVKAYQNFAASVDFWFYVIFTIKATRRGTIEERCDDIIGVIQDCGTKGFQFLVARHDDIVNDPLGKVFVPANKPDGFVALSQLS